MCTVYKIGDTRETHAYIEDVMLAWSLFIRNVEAEKLINQEGAMQIVMP